MSVLQELTDTTKTWIELASEIYGHKFRMPVVYADISGVCAGKANYKHWRIRYNPELYLRHKTDFLNRTVPHEVAHLIAYVLNGGRRPKPHGYEWQSVMRKLGIENSSRCHNYNVEGLVNRRPRPYIYACSCAEHHVTNTIHKKVQAGRTRICRRCGQRIYFLRTEDAA